jgi:hypothetical protein
MSLERGSAWIVAYPEVGVIWITLRPVGRLHNRNLKDLAHDPIFLFDLTGCEDLMRKQERPHKTRSKR